MARASGETLDLEGFMIVSVCSFFLPVFFYFCFFSSSIFYSFFILLFLLLLLSTSRVIILPISGQLLHYTTFTTQFNFISTYIQIHNIQIYTPRSFSPNPSDVTQASLNQRTADQSALKYITNISQTILYTSYTLRRL